MTLVFFGMAVLGYAILKLSHARNGNGLTDDYLKLDTKFGIIIGVILIAQSFLDFYLKSDAKCLIKAAVYTINFILLYTISRKGSKIYIEEDGKTRLRSNWILLAVISVIPSIIVTILI